MPIAIQWYEDSSGRFSIHSNQAGLTPKESYLGHTLQKADGEKISWYFRIKGEDQDHGPYGNVEAARRGLKSYVKGEEVDEWYGGSHVWRS